MDTPKVQTVKGGVWTPATHCLQQPGTPRPLSPALNNINPHRLPVSEGQEQGSSPRHAAIGATLNITTSAFAVKRFVFATDIFALSFPSIKFPAEILPFRERQASSLARDIDHVCRDLAISYANRAQNGCRRIPGKLTMRRLPLTPMSPIVERPSFLELANSLLTVLHRTGNLTG